MPQHPFTWRSSSNTMKTTLLILAVVGYTAAQQLQNQPPIPILRQASDISPDGTFSWSYETGNGIQADAQGTPAKVQSQDPALGPPIVHQGRFSYTADDGTPISVQYIADENGFQPQGAHLPTPPPIPAEIQRALEFIARNPQPQYQQQ